MTPPLGRCGPAVVIGVLALSCSRVHAARSLDLHGARGQRVFFALGFLHEYSGRHVAEGDDRVEGFYCVSLLNELGCTNVHVESTQGLIPQTNTIQFDPTPEVRGWIDHPPL